MAYEDTVVAGRFEIERLAGRGGMASVYRAIDRRAGGSVALKILHGGSSAGHGERFAREVQLLAEVTHPAIVRYIDHGSTELDEPYLVMEWLEGEDLSARLHREGLGAGEAVRLARRVAEALGAAHARGVVHRDVKPSNLFLVDGDIARVKVLDFGIARVKAAPEAVTRTGAAIGTPGYMAPEQARGSRDLDARADVFSLGCVLFECLAGHAPFVGDTAMAVLAKILLEDAPRLGAVRDDLPAALEQLVARMLAKDPKARPADGAMVATELEAIGELADAKRAPVRLRDSAVTVGEQRLVCMVFAQAAVPGAGTPTPTPRDTRTDPAIESARTIADISVGSPTGPSGTQVEQVETARTVSSAAVGDALPALSATVTTHGGRAEVLADGSVVVTVFGQGTATDQAARAARCALAVRDVVPHAPMALAIGRCVVGDRVPFGELIDRAAGLLRAPVVSALGPTQMIPVQPRVRPIRVDEVSAGLLDIRFVIEGDDTGLVLVGERDVADPARTLLGRPTPCVGRERELAMLAAIFDECVAEPMAHLVVVTAAAGVGKSRLRHELVQRLATAHSGSATGLEIWIGRANPMSAGAPFAMLAQALRRAAGIVDGETLAVRHLKLKARVSRHVQPGDAVRIAEFLGELVGAPLPDGGSLQLRAARQDPQLMGDQMLRACEDFVAAECAAGPVLLVLEDLHWGDTPTVKFVDAVVRQLPDRPLMVLALARPEVDTVFPRLWAERGVERIHLGELTKRAAEKLVRDSLGKDLDDATVARIVDRSAGNAFYLEELIRFAVDPKFGADGGDQLPETIVAMAQARIEGLELEARLVLRAASIFGQTFWRGGVMTLLDGGTTQVRDWLDELAHRELISMRRESRFPDEQEFAFRHALVREAAYAMLPERDRTRGHRLAGEWLEARIRDERPLERAAEAEARVLAEHFERGGDPRRAVSWYRQAAEQALEGDDLGTAIELAERALRCLAASDDVADTDRATIGALRQLESGAHVWRGEYALAAERGAEALERLPIASTPWLNAAAAIADGCARMLDHDQVLALCRSLAGIGTTSTTHRAYTHAVAMTMSVLLWHGDADLIGRLFARLDRVEAEVRGSDPTALAWIFHARSWRAMREGDSAACLALDTRVVECFTAVGDLRHACQQRANVGYDELMLGAFTRAEASLREAITLATRIGLHQVTSQAQHNLGLALLRQGRIPEARHVEKVALDAFDMQENRRLACAARHYLALIELAAGNVPLAIELGRDAIASTEGEPGLLCSFHGTMANAYRIAGNAMAALTHASTAIELMATHGRPEEGESAVRLAYAEALHALGSTEAAVRAITDAEARLLEIASKIGDPTWRRSFLEAVPENAATLRLAHSWRR